MVDYVSLVVYAVLLSGLYALVSVGFTMIFGIGGILNIAHGANIVIGAYSAYVLVRLFEFSIWWGALAAVIVPGVFSVIIYVSIIQYIEEEPITVVILTLMILLIVEQALLFAQGTTQKTIPQLLAGRVTILGTEVQSNRILMFGLSWVFILFVVLYMRTRTGKAIQALSMNRKGAGLVGIDPFRITVYVWFIAGMLAGAAGLFFGSFQAVSYDMGLAPLLLSFAIVILGGIGSIKGSVLGAYIIGSVETITVTFIDPRLTGASSLAILFLILIIRPKGLFGREEVA